MESSIIAEGFTQYIDKHGIVYHEFIWDADSSVAAALSQIYPGITVRKLECKTNLIRNFHTKLAEISEAKFAGVATPPAERQIPIMVESFMELKKAVAGAFDTITTWGEQRFPLIGLTLAMTSGTQHITFSVVT